MNVDELKQAFAGLAERLGGRLHGFPDQSAMLCLALESPSLHNGYIRLCLDADDAVVIAETAIPLAGVVPPTAPALDKLLALQFMSGPLQSGRLIYPAIDLRNRHVVLSYAVGAAALRSMEDLVAFAEECAAETDRMAASAGMLNMRSKAAGRLPGKLQ
jgi:hypothetical protein